MVEVLPSVAPFHLGEDFFVDFCQTFDILLQFTLHLFKVWTTGRSTQPPPHWLLARCLALLYWIGDSFTSSLTLDHCNDIIHSKDDSSSFQPSRLRGCRCLCSKDFVFSGLCNDAGQSRLSGACPGHHLPAAAAHVLTPPRQPGQPGPQPLREGTQHMVYLLNLFLALKNTHSQGHRHTCR
ncbi:hypothetical protein SRHO_G00131610 [Serrasalmus rhombeus]